MLNADIRQPYKDFGANTKCAILNALWDSQYSPKDFYNNPSLGESYLRYYSDQCGDAFARRPDCLNLLIATHQDIVNIVLQLRDPSCTRQELKQSLSSRLSARPPSPLLSLPPALCEQLCSEVVDLCVRLWLMVDIGTAAHNSLVPGQKPLLWQSSVHDRISTVLAARFTTHIAIRERVKIGRIFNAYNLERIAGLKIFWTSNLADHLRLTDDDSRIAIFYHASFLNGHRGGEVFPPGFVEETLMTLALLLPQYDKMSRKWFRVQGTKSCLDEAAAVCGHLTAEERQIENFVFWHDRLVILKQVFDDAEPSTIAQWWYDRRRRVQWYTFWVAAIILGLTILYGTVQCVEGGWQVYKAYYPS